MEDHERQAKDIVEGIEHEWAGVGECAEWWESALCVEVEKEKRAREEAERKIDHWQHEPRRVAYHWPWNTHSRYTSHARQECCPGLGQRVCLVLA